VNAPYTYTFDDIRNRPVTVIGAGTLGRRIALMFASRGGTVRIYGRRDEQLAAAKLYVAETLPRVIDNRGFGEPGVVTVTTSLAQALDDAWLAVESAPEKLEVKVPLWGEIDGLAPAGTIFATNSSSYPSRLMSENISDKTRLCNTHFYMPPEVNGLDLMSDGETDRGLLDTLLTVLPEFGVYPFEALKECTGFIFNRVWAAIKRESLALSPRGWPVRKTSTGCTGSTWARRPARFS
jgi:3-hydroxybutyryl-CoA dehydrogenase